MSDDSDNQTVNDGKSNSESLGSTISQNSKEATGGETDPVTKGKTGGGDGSEGGYGFIRPSAESDGSSGDSGSSGSSESE